MNYLFNIFVFVLIFFSIGCGFAWTMHVIDRVYHISDDRRLLKIRKCKHVFKVVVRCKHCEYKTKIFDEKSKKTIILLESLLNSANHVENNLIQDTSI